jgi:phosphoglycolate phosphatase
MEQRRYVLFDLDGTLTDPLEGIFNSSTYALEKLGYAPPSLDAVRSVIGPPIREGFSILGVEPERIEEALTLYRERYVPIGLYENLVIEGIPELLNELLNADVVMGVATSKVESYARDILSHFGLADFFTIIAGASLNGVGEMKSTVIADCLHRLGRRADEPAIMIGDRHHDVQGAVDNGIACIGVSWGFGSPQELEEAGAVAVVTTTAELRSQLVLHEDLPETLSTTEWSGS